MNELRATIASDVEQRRHISKPLKLYCKASDMKFISRYGRATITLTTKLSLMPDIQLSWQNEAYYGFVLSAEGPVRIVTIYDQDEMRAFIKVLRGMRRLRPGHRRP